MSRIKGVASRMFEIPPAEVLTDAMHGEHRHFEQVTATVTTDDGLTGTGYTYTGGRGGIAIGAMIDHDLAPALLGRDARDVEGLYDHCGWHVHYVGRGGTAFAGWLEIHSFPIDAYTTRPLMIRDHLAVAQDAPGTGVEFDWKKLSPYQQA